MANLLLLLKFIIPSLVPSCRKIWGWNGAYYDSFLKVGMGSILYLRLGIGSIPQSRTMRGYEASEPGSTRTQAGKWKRIRSGADRVA
jgi:hypothetical protein